MFYNYSDPPVAKFNKTVQANDSRIFIHGSVALNRVAVILAKLTMCGYNYIVKSSLLMYLR